MCRLS